VKFNLHATLDIKVGETAPSPKGIALQAFDALSEAFGLQVGELALTSPEPGEGSLLNTLARGIVSGPAFVEAYMPEAPRFGNISVSEPWEEDNAS